MLREIWIGFGWVQPARRLVAVPEPNAGSADAAERAAHRVAVGDHQIDVAQPLEQPVELLLVERSSNLRTSLTFGNTVQRFDSERTDAFVPAAGGIKQRAQLHVRARSFQTSRLVDEQDFGAPDHVERPVQDAHLHAQRFLGSATASMRGTTYHRAGPRGSPSARTRGMVRAVRLALVTQDFPPGQGGIQTWALEIAKRLAERCDGFAVIAPSAASGSSADQALGFRVLRSGSSNSLIAAAAPALARLALRDGFTHSLHAQWSTAPAALALRAAGKLRHVTIAVHGRELLLAPWQRIPIAQRAYDAVRRRSLTASDRILGNSRFTAGLVRELGVPDERVRLTHCGTDPERFRPTDASELRARHGIGSRPVLLTIARLVPRKAIDLVLRAFAEVRSAVPDAMYVIAGDGPDLKRLRGLAQEFGDAVRFVGPVSDAELPAWYSLGDVFVMPARSEPPDIEGFGIVFLEASACERAVVAARAGGIPDAVDEGVTGLLISPGDERELARRLIELLSDPARRAELGRRGRERVLAEFTWDRVADRTLAAIGD